ncbi:hypothetical protein Tco_1242091, partial [Tanacetum coccineum]
MAPSDDEVPAEDQPLPADASPTADSPGYIADSEPIEDDFEEDPEMDHVDYIVDDEEEESSDDEEEEEHLAPADSALPVPDSVPSSEETEPYETNKSAATPPSPHTVVPLSQTGLCGGTKDSSTPNTFVILHLGSDSASPSTYHPLLSSEIPSPPLTLPSPDRGDAILEADMPPQKRTCFIAPSH